MLWTFLFDILRLPTLPVQTWPFVVPLLLSGQAVHRVRWSVLPPVFALTWWPLDSLQLEAGKVDVDGKTYYKLEVSICFSPAREDFYTGRPTQLMLSEELVLFPSKSAQQCVSCGRVFERAQTETLRFRSLDLPLKFCDSQNRP